MSGLCCGIPVGFFQESLPGSWHHTPDFRCPIFYAAPNGAGELLLFDIARQTRWQGVRCICECQPYLKSQKFASGYRHSHPKSITGSTSSTSTDGEPS